jgi:hypothetical protein
MNNSKKVNEVSQILKNRAFKNAVGMKAMVKLNQEVSKLGRQMDDIETRRFQKSVELGRLINKAHKVINQTKGINLKQFCEATFGWSINAGMGNKYSRIGGASDKQVSEFQEACADSKSEWRLTIEDFKNWLSSGKPSKAKAKSSTIFTMAYKGEEGNVAVRISDSGEVKTTNSKAEILGALEYLKKCYAEQCAKASAEATTTTIIGDAKPKAKVSAEAIEKKALEQARLSELKAEKTNRESVDDKHFKGFYDAFCKAEKLVFDVTEFKAWKRSQLRAYRVWFDSSDENKAYLGAWLNKQAKAIK